MKSYQVVEMNPKVLLKLSILSFFHNISKLSFGTNFANFQFYVLDLTTPTSSLLPSHLYGKEYILSSFLIFSSIPCHSSTSWVSWLEWSSYFYQEFFMLIQLRIFPKPKLFSLVTYKFHIITH